MVEISNIKKEIKKYRYVYIAVFLIFILGVFLRLYKFGPLMHFELDQARDVFIINDSIKNGLSELPLLGPQARGKELYLGPVFYYFSYLSNLIFGVSPESMVLPDLFSSIFSILLLYFFARLFFSRWISVAVMAISASSLFLIIYGRFAWNPNSMVFWSLVTFYSLLRAYRDRKFSSRWFLLSALGFGILTQLHFIAFIVTPLVILSYLIITRMRIPWKSLVWSLLILIFLYSPVIFSEIRSEGKNINSFFSAISLEGGVETLDDKEDGANRGFIEKALRAFQETSTFYWNIISSDNNGGYNIRIKKDEQRYFKIICNENCKNSLSHQLIAIFIFTFSFLLSIYFLIKIYRKKNIQNDFRLENIYNRYLLIFLWLFFGEIFLILVAYQISPRFFLFLVVPFLILLGTLFKVINDSVSWGKWVVTGMVVIFVSSNLINVTRYFSLLEKSQKEKELPAIKDLVLNQNDIVTLGQLREAGAYLNSLNTQSNKFLIVGDNSYARALYYVTKIENNSEDALCYIKFADFESAQLNGETYYLLLRSKSKNQIISDMLIYHKVQEWKNFGTVNLYKMIPNNNVENNQLILPKGCFKR